MAGPHGSRRDWTRLWKQALPQLPRFLVAAGCLGLPAPGARAQVPPDLTRERAEFAKWLATAPLSPYAAIALQPVGAGISLGPADSDVPAPGLRPLRVVEEKGLLRLADDGGSRSLPRGRPLTLGTHTLLATGDPGRTVVALYGPVRGPQPPTHYPYQPSLRFTSRLEPPERRGSFRSVGLDGVEAHASEAGFFPVTLRGNQVRLRVYRFSDRTGEEAELYVYFRDATNGRGTYPAGRFVELIPAGDRQYTLDFNRARNPFCAYSAVYPCPVPWPGNGIPLEIAAGERYHGGGLQAPP